MNNKEEFELELILSFFNEKIKDESVKQIKEMGYDKYQDFLLFNDGDLVSPIFNIDKKQIGNAYKYNSSINDYIRNINFEIRKIFLLYINYQQLNEKFSKGNNFCEYYMVNKNWMKYYKKYFNYEAIREAMNKNVIIQNILNNQLNYNKSINYKITDTIIAKTVYQLPKNLVVDFDMKNKNIKNYKNEEARSPNVTKITYNSNKYLLYYYDFELISAEIYDYFFKNIETNVISQENNYQNSLLDKAGKVECFFDKKYIIIKNPNPNSQGKY